MPLTYLTLLPLSVAAPSPLPQVLSHITLSFSCQPLPIYSLSHHVYITTSSLLPAHTSSRQYTHLLNTSHDPSTCYVGTTTSSDPSDAQLTQITIPTGSTREFLALMNTKFQPHWSHRASLAVNDGTSLRIDTPNGDFILRVGELRVLGAGNAANNLRGVLFEVTAPNGLTGQGEVGEKTGEEDERVCRAFLERILQGTGVGLEGTRVAGRWVAEEEKPKDAKEEGMDGVETEKADRKGRKEANWALAGLYMELLRTMR